MSACSKPLLGYWLISNEQIAAPAPRPQQLPSKQHPFLPPTVRQAPAALLDHTFVGMSGGQIFHEMMLRHNVKHIFGYPGGTILPVFDAIYNSKHFDFILPRHEQGAGHMAEGYARVSGKPGVVLVTSGPGATNVVTPMQDALSDGVPIIVFSGQVATSAIGSDAFQEADIVGISRSCTKWNVMVKDIAELPRRINEAFKIATSGRPGPVLVDLPKDITAGILRTPLPFKATTPGLSLGLPSNPLQLSEPPTDLDLIQQAAALINQARRPIIYAGNGVLSSPEGPKLLAALAEHGNIPVTTTLQGLGAFDETSDKSLHMVGMHGSAYANRAMQQADVIIALGARFDDRVTMRIDKFAPAAMAAGKEARGGSVKLVGLFVTALVGVYTIEDLWDKFGDLKMSWVRCLSSSLGLQMLTSCVYSVTKRNIGVPVSLVSSFFPYWSIWHLSRSILWF